MNGDLSYFEKNLWGLDPTNSDSQGLANTLTKHAKKISESKSSSYQEQLGLISNFFKRYSAMINCSSCQECGIENPVVKNNILNFALESQLIKKCDIEFLWESVVNGLK